VALYNAMKTKRERERRDFRLQFKTVMTSYRIYGIAAVFSRTMQILISDITCSQSCTNVARSQRVYPRE